MNIFCYNALIWPDIWRHTVRNDYASVEAHIRGFHCRKVKKENYPALVRSRSKSPESDQVPGKLYFDISASDFLRAKDFIGKEFEVLEGVCFTEDSDIPQSAKVFIFKAEYRTLLSNEPWTKEWFEEKALKLVRQDINSALL